MISKKFKEKIYKFEAFSIAFDDSTASNIYVDELVRISTSQKNS